MPNMITQSQGAAPQRHGSLFGDSAFRLPKMTFGRNTTGRGPKPTSGNQPVAHRVASNANPYFQNQSRGGRLVATRQPAMPGAANARMPVGQPMRNSPSQVAGRPNQQLMQTSQPMAGQRQQQLNGSRQASLPRPSAVPSQTVHSRSMSEPQAQRAQREATIPLPVAESEPVSAQPRKREATRPAAQPTTREATSPGDKLVMQAHELTSTAESEEDYSRIIETCRRARASQAGSEAAAYANDLAAWAFNRRGQVKAEAGRDNEAMLDFEDAIRSKPDLWRAIHNRGVLEAQTGEFAKAFDDFNRTIELSPQFAKAYCNRAALFTVANDLPAAAKDYARAIELDPNLAVAHRGRARVCHLLGHLEQAINHYDAAVQLAPRDAYAISSRADLLTDLGRYEDAIAGYEEAIRLEPQSYQSYSSSAWLLATCPDSTVRNPRLAMERAGTAIELCGKEDAVGLDTLAAAQASAGDFEAAAESIHKALDLAPADERRVYEERLELYQRGKAYRIAPVQKVAQASYESLEQNATSGE
jgi:tetratricopeptide (TPR) repeat protein